ncbi:MAG: NAD-dependent epimerase/dehydratase family protein [Chloroflexi bacterium]|nr:NAD-dependent epimerase/dehydratase family protein [Chloroflexota bacterium]
MNFLITGVAGFLGAALAARLVREGHQVRGIDDLSTGDPRRVPPGVHFSRGDVNDRPKLWTLLQDVDCVYHLAARVSVPESVLYPSAYNHVNVGGTVSLMEAARDAGVRRVVLVSSGAIYGRQDAPALHEDLRPNPGSPYAVSKLAAEYYVHTLGRLWGIETVALRVFNAYGPGQPLPPAYPPVIPNFLYQAVRGGTLVIHGDGRQTRDFVYVDDVVRALVAAGTAPGLAGQVINVGSGEETSIRELANLILELTGRRATVLFNPRRDRGVERMRADLTKARRLLGYQPRYTLREGLLATLRLDPRFSAVWNKALTASPTEVEPNPWP